MRRLRFSLLFSSTALINALWLASSASADVTIDGTTSAARSLAGPNYAITPDLGRQAGANLFHSFGRFNLSAGETAAFSGPSSVVNVIGRVTGGTASSIDGTIRSTIPGSNLFLVNPAGIVFGANARIDVPGAFRASTADHLSFADGTRFSATTPNGSSFTMAPPTAFGFLTASPAPISVNGSRLSAQPGGEIAFVAGGISLTGAELSAPGGRIHLSAVAAAGEVGLDPAQSGSIGAATLGGISLVDSTLSADGGSGVFLNGRDVSLTRSTVRFDGGGAATPGPIAIRGDDTVALTDGSQVRSTTADAAGAPISIRGGRIVVAKSEIVSEATGNGAGGAIAVDAPVVELSSGARIATSASRSTGGNITITASDRLDLIGTSSISVGARPVVGSDPQSGSLFIDAGTLRIAESSTISALTETAGAARLGGITITARALAMESGGSIRSLNDTSAIDRTPGAIRIEIADNAALAEGTSIRSRGSSSRPAAIALSASSISLDAAQIISERGIGAIGDVVLSALDSIELRNGSTIQGGGIHLDASRIDIVDSSLAVTFPGVAPTLELLADGITIRGSSFSSNGTAISFDASSTLEVTASTISATGGAGISLAAPDVFLLGSTIRTQPVGLTPNAAPVTITADSFFMSGGSVSVKSSGAPVAISITAASIEIDNGASIAATDSRGDLVITGEDVTLGFGARLSVTATGSNPAGSILVAADTISLSGGTISHKSAAFTSTNLNATAISLEAASEILLSDGARIVATNATADVALTAPLVTLTDGSSVSIVGAGSNPVALATLRISADAMFMDGSSISSTLGPLSTGGSIVVDVAGTFEATGSSLLLERNGSLGNPGMLALTADRIVLGGSSIASVANGGSRGAALKITAADTVSLFGASEIRTEAGANDFARSTGGDIVISAGSLSLAEDSAIATHSFGASDGAGVSMQVQGALTIADFARVLTRTEGGGAGGEVRISAGEISLSDGGQIASESTGSVRGGALQIEATGDVSVRGFGSAITSLRADDNNTAGAIAGGGAISIAAASVTVDEGGEITSTSTGVGDAGDITVTAGTAGSPGQILVGSGSRIDSTALSFDASPGRITIIGAVTLVDDGFIGVSRTGTITTDGTLGPALVLVGPDFLIPAELGTRAGANLFHSFETFILERGERAIFLGPDEIANVIARITGGDPARINGTIRSAMPHANIFLVSATGLVFGASATLDVPASFSLAAADYIRFADGARFSAFGVPGGLSASAPLAAGFEGSQGILSVSGSQLSLQPRANEAAGIRHDLSLTGSTVLLRSAALGAAGTIRIAAAGSDGEIAFDPADEAVGTTVSAFGTVSATGKSSIASARPAGDESTAARSDIVIRAADLTISDSTVSTSASSQASGGKIDIRASSLTLTADTFNGGLATATAGDAAGGDIAITADIANLAGGRIATSTSDAGDAGNITVTAGTVSIFSATIASDSSGAGKAGRIALSASDTILLGENGVVSTSTSGTGAGGTISLAAPSIFIESGKLSTAASGSGAGGDIIVTGDSISLTETLVQSTASGIGNAGSVALSASVDLSLFSTSVASTSSGDGNAGAVTLSAGGDLMLFDTQVSSSATGAGAAGNITLTAANDIVLDFSDVASTGSDFGASGSVTLQGNRIQLGFSNLYATGSGIANAGDIRLVAVEDISLDVSTIQADTFGAGVGGAVLLNAGGDIVLSGSIVTSNVGDGATGPGGSVTFLARNITIDSSFVAAATLGEGAAGNLSFKAANDIALVGAELNTSSTGDVLFGAGGPGGTIMLTAGGSIQSSASFVLADTDTDGDAGQIRLQAPVIRLDDGSLVSSLSTASGNAGTITIEAPQELTVTNASTVASLTVGTGAAGKLSIVAGVLEVSAFSVLGSDLLLGGDNGASDIDVVAQDIRITGGGAISSGTLTDASAGNVRIKTGSLFIDGSDLLASTGITSETGGNGNAGSISIHASGAITILGGGEISSSTGVDDDFGPGGTMGIGDGGAIDITAGSLSLDGSASSFRTGILSSSGAGRGGDITINVDGPVSLLNFSRISSSTSDGTAGTIKLNAGALSIDGADVQGGAGILANTFNTGKGGAVAVTTSGMLRVGGGGEISSSSFGPGDAGSVSVNAPRILVDGAGAQNRTGILSGSFGAPEGSGNAGTIAVDAGDITLMTGGVFSTEVTGSNSRASSIAVRAGTLTIAGGHQTLPTGITSDASRLFTDDVVLGGQVDLAVAGALLVRDGGQITSNILGNGSAGDVRVAGGSIMVSGGTIGSNALGADFAGKGGSVSVMTAGQLGVVAGGAISSSSFGQGDAGSVSVNAGRVLVDGSGAQTPTGILSASFGAPGGSGNAGTIAVDAGDVTLMTGGVFSTEVAGSNSRPSSIAVRADTLTIAGGHPTLPTGITSDASLLSSKDIVLGGRVDLTVSGQVLLRDGGQITSNIVGNGSAGDIRVAGGSIMVSAATVSSSALGASFAGKGGSIGVTTAGQLRIVRGGAVSSSSFGQGDAGSVSVNAGRVLVDGSGAETPTGILSASFGAPGGSGNAGTITVDAGDVTLMTGGVFSTEVTGRNSRASSIAVRAGALTIAGGHATLPTGIVSDASLLASDDVVLGGRVDLAVGGAVLLGSGGQITSNILGNGSAGDIHLAGGSIVISAANVSSDALGPAFAGNGGNVGVSATGEIRITDGGTISATSSGTGPAGTISVLASSLVLTNASAINANAPNGTGGNISIVADRLLSLNNASIIANARGNGGNISIDPDFVIIKNGTITARSQDGINGNIVLIAGQLLISPGSTVEASNQVTIVAPDTDVTSDLAALSSDPAQAPSITRQGCSGGGAPRAVGSLIEGGKGGLAPDGDGPQSAYYLNAMAPGALADQGGAIAGSRTLAAAEPARARIACF